MRKAKRKKKERKKERTDACSDEQRKKRDKKKENWKKKKKKRGEWSQKLRLVGPSMCVYLQDCHHNSVSITWKHLKCVFSFHNSSLKNQRIKWWKRNLKTNLNKLSLRGSHHFWVMGDGNTKTKQPLNLQFSLSLFIIYITVTKTNNAIKFDMTLANT